MQHNFRTVVLSDCVGDRAMEPHEANLFDMRQKYADVMRRDELLRLAHALRRTEGGRGEADLRLIGEIHLEAAFPYQRDHRLRVLRGDDVLYLAGRKSACRRERRDHEGALAGGDGAREGVVQLPQAVRELTRPVAAKDYWSRGLVRSWLAEEVFDALVRMLA